MPVEVQVVITDRALLSGDDTPAHVPGYGPVPAGWARDLLARATAIDDTGPPGESRARAWVRRLYTHPATGTLVAMDSRRRLFPTSLRRYVVARDGTCRTPWCDAPIAHADHVLPHAEGGPTSAANGQGLCVRCNLVKEEPGWTTAVVERGPGGGELRASGEGPGDDDVARHTVRLTTPTGHSYVSIAPPVLPDADTRPHRGGAPPGTVVLLELHRRLDLDVELTA